MYTAASVLWQWCPHHRVSARGQAGRGSAVVADFETASRAVFHSTGHAAACPRISLARTTRQAFRASLT